MEDGCFSLPLLSPAIDELKKGRELVGKLAGVLLPESLTGDCRGESWMEARVLVAEIMEKICQAIAVLSSENKKDENFIARTVSPSPDNSVRDAGRKKKMHSVRKSANRKRGNPYSWRVTSTTTEDGYLWRKYGQKEIFTAKNPRSYYRCTHKYDRDCKATRQVQQSEEDPYLYVITYFGDHTCETSAKNTNISTTIISFESNTTIGSKPGTPFSCIPSHKKDSEEEDLSNLTCVDSPSIHVLSEEQEELQKAVMAEIDSDMIEFSSSLQPWICNYEMEILDYENLFNFDQSELFQW